MAYAASSNVKVYPTAYRKNVNGTTWNPESTLNLEYNITTLGTRINSAAKDSYVISYDAEAAEITFVIHGYWFRLSNLSQLNHDASKPLYAAITLVNQSAVVSGATIENPRLTSWGGNAIIDNLDAANGEFQGLYFSDGPISVNNVTTFALQLLNEGQTVPDESYINLSTKQIKNADGNDPIYKQFNTEVMSVSSSLWANHAEFGVDGGDTAASIDADGNISGKVFTANHDDTGDAMYCIGDFDVVDDSGNVKFSITQSTGETLSQGKITANNGKASDGTTSVADVNATVVGVASRAISDGDGNNIRSTYANSLVASVSSGEATISMKNNTFPPTRLGSFKPKVSSGTKADGSTSIISSADYNQTTNVLTLTLGTSGASAGIYGASADKTLTWTDGKFKIPYIRVNDKGLVTSIEEHEITIPANPDTDTKYNFATGTNQGDFRYKKTTDTNYTTVSVKNLGEGDDVKFKSVTATVSFNVSSDERLKDNIEDFSPKGSILDLGVKQFDYRQDGSHHIGCIAQDVQRICPEIVHENEDGYLTLEEGKLVYLLLDEVKKLRKELDELKGGER